MSSHPQKSKKTQDLIDRNCIWERSEKGVDFERI